MLDELLEIFERDRGSREGAKRTGLRARLARFFGGGDDEDDGEDRRAERQRERERRERNDRFDWGDD